MVLRGGNPILKRCHIVNNFAGEYDWGGAGVDMDSEFVGALEGDYHLRWDSPCIDTGDPAYIPTQDDKDIDNEPQLMRNNCVDIRKRRSRAETSGFYTQWYHQCICSVGILKKLTDSRK